MNTILNYFKGVREELSKLKWRKYVDKKEELNNLIEKYSDAFKVKKNKRIKK